MAAASLTIPPSPPSSFNYYYTRHFVEIGESGPKNYLDILSSGIYNDVPPRHRGDDMKDIKQEDVGYLTIQEAATLLGVHRSALYLAIKEGRLEPVRVLGRTALRRADVEAYHPRAYRSRRDDLADSQSAP